MKIEDVIQSILGNRKKLENCNGHDFSIDLNPEIVAGKRWACNNCNGTVSSIQKSWYEEGLKHGTSKSSIQHSTGQPTNFHGRDGDW